MRITGGTWVALAALALAACGGGGGGGTGGQGLCADPKGCPKPPEAR